MAALQGAFHAEYSGLCAAEREEILIVFVKQGDIPVFQRLKLLRRSVSAVIYRWERGETLFSSSVLLNLWYIRSVESNLDIGI